MVIPAPMQASPTASSTLQVASPLQGSPPANFAGQAPQPFPGQSAPVRRDRTVRAPGIRGGHFRRVWSERKHKFYIKYGDDGGLLRVKNANAMGVPAQDQDAQVAEDEPGQDDIASKENALRERMFESFYALLLGAFQAGPNKSGVKTGGASVSFGNLTPLNGEIKTTGKRALFLLLNESGEKIELVRRPIIEDDKQKEFFCFLTSIYVVNEFLQKHKAGEPIPSALPSPSSEEETSKSLVFSVPAKGSSKFARLYKSLEKLSKQNLDASYSESTEKIPQGVLPSALPLSQMVQLQKSLQHLHPRKNTKVKLSKLDKGLAQVNKTIDRLEKAWANEEDMRKAMGNPLGRMRGTAGAGRSQSTVFRRPGRPPGTSQNLSVASPGFKHMAQRPPVKESKEDWKNHKDLRIGARVRVQHPHSHEKPTWGRIVAIGQDGVSIIEDNGKATNIRWPHIHDIMPRLDPSPQNSFEMAKLGLPMTNVPMAQKHEEDLANRILRRYGMPHNDDMIHDDHDMRDDAYSELLSQQAPIDPVEATKSKTEGKSPLDSFKGNLIDAAIARKVPVNPELLRKLPLDKVVEVLHHHLNEGQER